MKKTYRNIGLMMVAVIAALSITACSDDEDDNNLESGKQDEIELTGDAAKLVGNWQGSKPYGTIYYFLFFKEGYGKFYTSSNPYNPVIGQWRYDEDTQLLATTFGYNYIGTFIGDSGWSGIYDGNTYGFKKNSYNLFDLLYGATITDLRDGQSYVIHPDISLEISQLGIKLNSPDDEFKGTYKTNGSVSGGYTIINPYSATNCEIVFYRFGTSEEVFRILVNNTKY